MISERVTRDSYNARPLICAQTWRRILALMALGVLPAVLVKLLFLQVPAGASRAVKSPSYSTVMATEPLVRHGLCDIISAAFDADLSRIRPLKTRTSRLAKSSESVA